MKNGNLRLQVNLLYCSQNNGIYCQKWLNKFQNYTSKSENQYQTKEHELLRDKLWNKNSDVSFSVSQSKQLSSDI